MNVFAYGSLMYRPVWERVVAGSYESLNGTLSGYARRRIVDEVHPALVPAPPESTVGGVVYLNVSATDLAALDRFEDEGDAYRRIQVPVHLEDGRTLDAWTYLYLHSDGVENAPWEPARFATEDIRHFLATYCRDRVAP